MAIDVTDAKANVTDGRLATNTAGEVTADDVRNVLLDLIDDMATVIDAADTANENFSDEDIGDKAASNPPNDLTDMEKGDFREAIGLTDAEIKTLYESNSDTNALTDALLTKINTLEVVHLGTVSTDAGVVSARDNGLNVLVATADITLVNGQVYDSDGTALTEIGAGDLLVWDDHSTQQRWERAVNLPSEITAAATNLSTSRGPSAVTIQSSTGTNASIPAASTGVAGVMTAAFVTRLFGIEAGAQVNPNAAEIKTLYESNSDTNALTDARLNKLNSITSGAEPTDEERVFDHAKNIVVAGDGITVTDDDTNNTITITADATDASEPEVIGIAASDEDTDLTVGNRKATFRMPFAMTLEEVRLSVTRAPTGANLVVDVNAGGTSIFSTRPRIDQSEKTSETAGTAAVITDTTLDDDAEITIDIDQIGSTFAGTGLKVYFIGTRT